MSAKAGASGQATHAQASGYLKRQVMAVASGSARREPGSQIFDRLDGGAGLLGRNSVAAQVF